MFKIELCHLFVYVNIILASFEQHYVILLGPVPVRIRAHTLFELVLDFLFYFFYYSHSGCDLP